MPIDASSWLIPAVSLYLFLQPYMFSSEPALLGNGHEVCHIWLSIALVHANINLDSCRAK